MATSNTSAMPEQNVLTSLSRDAECPFPEGLIQFQSTGSETFKEKCLRKSKQNPLVPVGCLATAGVLMYGLRAFHQGNIKGSQMLMRGRIAAQGFTVAALIVGVLVTALKSKE